MFKDSIRNIVVIFQTTILRIVGFYVRRSAYVLHYAVKLFAQVLLVYPFGKRKEVSKILMIKQNKE